MSDAIENLKSAQQKAMAGRPKVGGFPYLAEVLRQAGVTRNVWSLPACQSLYVTDKGSVVVQGTPLIAGMAEVPTFNREGTHHRPEDRSSGEEHVSGVLNSDLASRCRCL